MFHKAYRCSSSVIRAVGDLCLQTPAIGVPVPQSQAVGVPFPQTHVLLVFLFRKHTCCWCSCSTNTRGVVVPVPQIRAVGVPDSQTHVLLVLLFHKYVTWVVLFRKHRRCWCSCSANRCCSDSTSTTLCHTWKRVCSFYICHVQRGGQCITNLIIMR